MVINYGLNNTNVSYRTRSMILPAQGKTSIFIKLHYSRMARIILFVISEVPCGRLWGDRMKHIREHLRGNDGDLVFAEMIANGLAM